MPHVFFVVFYPFFLVVALHRIYGLGMESIEFILKVNFPLIVVHFSQLIELRIDVLMDVFYQLAVHHRLVDKLVIKFLL